MKRTDSMGDFSSLQIKDSLPFAFKSEPIPTQQDTVSLLLDRLSDIFHIDMSLFECSDIMAAIHERMQATKCSSLRDYLSLLETRSSEANAVFRQIVSSPDWGLNIVSIPSFKKLLELVIARFESHERIRIWISRCGLGYNVMNLILIFEELLTQHFCKRHQRPEYKIFATDMDYQLVKTANKMTIPDAYQDILYKGSLYHQLIDDSGELIRIKAAKRSLVNFAVHSHLQNHSLANIDVFVAVNLAEKLSSVGRRHLFQNITKSLKPGSLILCDDSSLNELLLASREFISNDCGQGIFEKIDLGHGNLKNKINATSPYIPSTPNALMAEPLNSSRSASLSNKFNDGEGGNVTKLFQENQNSDLSSLLKMKNDYIDLLHLEIDELYNQIQDMTEELSTSLEELETVNEELRISNDQLTTVNDQYSHKLEELSLYLKDYDQITDALNIALIFVDRSKKIRFFNSRAECLFGLCLKDLNRCFSDFIFSKTLNMEELFAEVKQDNRSIKQSINFKGMKDRFVKAMPFVVQQVNCEGVLFCIGDAEGIAL